MPVLPSRRCLGLLASVLVLASCERTEREPSQTPVSSASPDLTLPVAEPPLDREALLMAVAYASSDFAAGNDDTERQRQLDGRPFEVRLRFGCPGDQAGARQWSFDQQERVLRIRVEPQISGSTPLLATLGLDEFEAAEGFWVNRPWLLQPGCPAPRPAAGPKADAPASVANTAGEQERSAALPMIGIAQFYTDEDSRTLRRETKAYEATIKLSGGEAPSSRGYDLVLSGRLTGLAGGRVISCIGGEDVSPSCMISARIDHVSLNEPDGGILAQWSSG